MPRRTHSVPKYRHHRASGQAIVSIAGRDHYLGPWQSKASKLAYDAVIGEWLARGRQPHVEIAELTVVELIARYWRFAKGYYVKHGRSTGELDNIRSALRPLKATYGHTQAAEFGPLRLKAVRQKMVAAGLCRTVVNARIQKLKRVFSWAVSEELLSAEVANALAEVEGLKKGRSDIREAEAVKPVADEVVQTTLPHLPPVVADMVRFQRLTGCRPAEVCLLRACDIDRAREVCRPPLVRRNVVNKFRADLFPGTTSIFVKSGRGFYPRTDGRL